MSDPIAYIYSHDGDEHGVKFAVEICQETTLRETMFRHLFPDGESGAAMVEFERILAEVKDGGSYDFEDGWIVVKHGAAAIVDFLIYQLREAKGEERFADQRRYEELQGRQAAEAKYAQLRNALLLALGPNAPELVEKVAA